MSILNARIGQSIGFMVAAIILAIAATVLAFIFIVPEKKREKLNAFGKFLHDTCNFKYLVVEKLLQALYIFLTAYFILQGFFMLFQTSYGTWLGGAGLAIMIISPIVLRLVYELLMMAVILVKNVIMINKKLKDQNGNGNITVQSILNTYAGAVIKPQDSGDNWSPESDAERKQYSVIMQAIKTRYEGTNPFSSRIVAIGGMEFLNTSFLQTASVNNSQLIMNIFNVSCNKEEGITLTPKSYNASTFEITDAQKNGLAIGFVIVLPLLLIISGIVIWVKRLHK